MGINTIQIKYFSQGKMFVKTNYFQITNIDGGCFTLKTPTELKKTN